jgi:hypothetical protein
MRSLLTNWLKKITLFTTLTLLFAPTSACNSQENIAITITPTTNPLSTKHDFISTPTPWLDIEYPPETRTGIEQVDNVIDAILDQDVDARLDFVHTITTPCTNADGLGGPPKCQPDEEEGTPLQVFPVSYGEGTYVRQEDIRNGFDFTVRGLFAVYRVPEDAYQADYWPAGEYGLVFTSEDGGHPYVIIALVEDGRLCDLAIILVGHLLT